jgi:hypothetical protein
VSEQPPTILIASASPYERTRLRHRLAETGWELADVSCAEEAAQLCGDNGRSAILLIDGGLLAEIASPEWRALRERYPTIGAVVRSLIPREGGILRPDPYTILVDPDDGDGLHEALHLLQSALASPAS